MPKRGSVSSPARESRELPDLSDTGGDLAACLPYLPERNGAPGNELEDWIRAERELLEQAGKAASRRSRNPSPLKFA